VVGDVHEQHESEYRNDPDDRNAGQRTRPPAPSPKASRVRFVEIFASLRADPLFPADMITFLIRKWHGFFYAGRIEEFAEKLIAHRRIVRVFAYSESWTRTATNASRKASARNSKN